MLIHLRLLITPLESSNLFFINQWELVMDLTSITWFVSWFNVIINNNIHNQRSFFYFRVKTYYLLFSSNHTLLRSTCKDLALSSVRTICLSGATYLHSDCCFSQLEFNSSSGWPKYRQLLTRHPFSVTFKPG
jgi:hypothetical protein